MRRFIWLPLALVGAILAAYGLYAGQYAGVLTKAVHICLECIGIG